MRTDSRAEANEDDAGGKWGFRGGAPNAEMIFTVFHKKIRIFKHTLV